MKELRARVMQHIVKTRLQEKYGDAWWDKLLLHMREEASDPTSVSGKTYGRTLKRAGRKVSIEDLDTSALSAVILFDDYFRNGKNAISYSPYELDLARKLHAIRNTISHDESGNNEKDLEDATLHLLRDAVDKLDLLEKNQPLASDIMEEYANRFGLQNDGGDVGALITRTKRFKEAEDLFKWNIEQAIPIYEELADEGFKGAQEKLLWIYTHTVRNFDLTKAVSICEKYKNLVPDSDKKILKELAGMLPHVIWGTKQACDQFGMELEKKRLIDNDLVLKYIRWINNTFPKGLLVFWDGETEPELKRSMLRRCPDMNSLWHQVEKPAVDAMDQDRSPGDKPKVVVYASFLLWLAQKQRFEPAHTQKALERFAETGYQPLVQYFAKSGNKNFATTAKSQTNVFAFPDEGKAKAKEPTAENASAQAEVNGNAPDGTAKDQTEQTSAFAVMQTEIVNLQKENKKLRMALYVCAAATAISILIAVVSNIM